MKKTTLTVLVTPLLLTLAFSPGRAQAQSASRLSDKQVEETMKQLGDGLDRFVDKMNPQIRTAVIKNERGETDVKACLDDLRKSRDAMSRFNPRKPAGPAASVWTGVSGDLAKVAKAYGVKP